MGRAAPVLEPGHVWLAGAGPGDPGMLTLDVLAGLAQAEVVVHDDLVDPRILAMAPATAELRFVGVKVGSEGNVLTGEIQEFLIDDLGYSVDWTLRIRYVVKDAAGQVLFDQVKTTERNTNKFANVFGALNETIKLNAEALLKDPAFAAAIK